MDKLNDVMESGRVHSKEAYDKAMAGALGMRDQAFYKMGINQEDIDKLNVIPFFCSVVGIFVNILLLAAISNFAWLEGTAMRDGQPYQVHLSLGAAIFGPPSDPTRDNKFFCDRSSCSLKSLCQDEPGTELFENGDAKYTSASTWCSAANAGSLVGGLLGFGFIPALAATLFTFIYAARDIAYFSTIYQKAEQMGMKENVLKYVVVGCWAALWVFMFVAMTAFAAAAPSSLGWGDVRLEASFGLLRFSLMLISIFGAMLASHLFELWLPDQVAEAWSEFTETPFFSWKKALYLELILQMVLYFFLTIYMVDWALLLVIIAGYYLDAKVKNFKIMYIVLVSISIVFDIFRFAALPSSSNMTPGESFGNTLWTFIFLLKPLIIGTIFMYEKERDAEMYADGNYGKMDDAGQGMEDNDEIAE